MLLSLYTIKAQGDNSVNMYESENEIKLNELLPLFGSFEATYERILNKKSSLGISFSAPFGSGNIESTEDDENYYISSIL